MNTLRRLIQWGALGATVSSVFIITGCETRERVVVHDPPRERVVVTAPPPPVVQERVIVRP